MTDAEKPGTSNTTEKKSAGKSSSAVSLIRPANSLMIGIAVLVGIAVSTHSPADLVSTVSLLGFVTGFAISCFSMVSNDIYDIEVDKINQPERPLPSGLISSREAYAISVLFLVVGLVASLLIGIVNFGIALLFAFIGWFYNYSGKKHGILGNSLVALSVAIPYIFGSVAVGRLTLDLAYLLALTSFLAGLGREVLKGIADISGDKARGIRSIAMVQGVETAKKVSASLFISAVLSSTIPLYFSGLLGTAFWLYTALVAIPDALFIFLSYKVLTIGGQGRTEALKYKTVALVGMLLGLIAYLIAGLAY